MPVRCTCNGGTRLWSMSNCITSSWFLRITLSLPLLLFWKCVYCIALTYVHVHLWSFLWAFERQEGKFVQQIWVRFVEMTASEGEKHNGKFVCKKLISKWFGIKIAKRTSGTNLSTVGHLFSKKDLEKMLNFIWLDTDSSLQTND